MCPRLITHPDLDDALYLEVVDSTNLEAQRLRSTYAGRNLLIVSSSQSAGKGQYGRRWESAAGLGLWATLFLGRSRLLTQDLHLLSLYTGIIVSKTLGHLTDMQFKLKWPNDIMIGSRKCAGILTEVQWQGESINSAIVGIGINLKHSPSDFPPDIQDTATSLQMEGWPQPDRDQILIHLLGDFFGSWSMMNQPEALVGLWNQNAYQMNRMVNWRSGEDCFKGRFLGINDRGEARLSVGNELREFGAGELQQLKG